MQYPKFLNNNSTIGICAPSGCVGDKEVEFDFSLSRFREKGYSIIETKSVRNTGDVSNTPKVRWKELMELVDNPKVEAIICAKGGDFLTDMLPYIDYSKIKDNPKWYMGYSDPTNLLYTITTRLDIATIYGNNAGSFDSKDLHMSQEIGLNVLSGDIPIQNSYPYYEKNRDDRIDLNYSLTEENKWLSNKDKIDITGRIIGGCIDCLRYLPGTKYDYTKEFIEKYKNDGIIWYFDVFSMSAEYFYLTLFQLKEAGWFSYVKGIIVGRVLFPSGFTTMTYEKALTKVFGDIPIIMEADIGHVPPKMTIINGSIVNIKYSDNKGSIEHFLK